MRLADDERARVPFALIGVLLLVGSLAVATVQFDDERVDTDVRIAGDRAEATAESALREAVDDAGASAAATPVVEPADTDYGTLLDEDRPFRSYLELLVALRIRERVADLEQRVDRTTAHVELPPIENRSTARAALNRTNVTAAGTGLVEVTVKDATIVVERDGEPVAERTEALSVTVATSVLTLHDRVTAFEERLDGGIATEGSVTRALTGGLYGLAWSRGWGQYLGLPIDDPIANRHVELLTNLALVDAQRATLGGADEAAERGLADAAVDVASQEAAGFAEGGFADAGLPGPTTDGKVPPPSDGSAGPRSRSTTGPRSGSSTDSVSSSRPESTVVGVNQTADRALADVLRSEPQGASDDDLAARSLDDLVRDALTVEAKLVTRQETQSRTLHDRTGPENASAWDREPGEPTLSVERVEEASGSAPAVPAGWSSARTERRRVLLEEVVPLVYTHRETGAVERGRAAYRRTVDVGIAVAHRPKPIDGVPERPLQSADSGTSGAEGDASGTDRHHEELVERAAADLLGEGADVDRLAGRAATDDLERDRVTVSPDDVRPERDAAYDDLAALREKLRSIQTRADRTFVVTDEDPAGELRSRVRSERDDYVDAQRRYADLEQRAAVAARAAYVERVLDRLDDRSEAGVAAQSALEDAAGELGTLPQGGLDRLLDVGLDYARPPTRPLNATDPAPNLQPSVSGSPGYLQRGALEVDRGAGGGAESSGAAESFGVEGPSGVAGQPRAPGTAPNGSHYPLAIRTRTAPSLQPEDVANRVASAVTGVVYDADDETVPLSTAARSLQGAERIPDSVAATADTSLGTDRRALRDDVAASVDVLEERSATVVAAETALSDRRARQVVDRALAEWPEPAARALAFDDGAAAEAIVATAAERPAVSEHERDRLLTVLRDALARELASESTHVRTAAAERVVDEARTLTEAVVANATESGLESAQDALEQRMDRVPKLGLRGVPLAPIPGYWVATANVWHVEVRGGYARFSASVPQGGPAEGGKLRYVRDGTPAAVDVTGDGSPELLGNSTRIGFEASTTVVVAVPPNGGGVGNAESDYGQTSPGWDAWTESSGGDRSG